MVKKLLLLPLILILACSGNKNQHVIPSTQKMKNAKFYIVIKQIVRERSKDSNRRITHLSVLDGNVVYTYKYRGFPRPSDNSKKYKLKSQQLNNLVAFIKKKKLNQNLNEEQQVDGLGISITLEVKIKLNNEITKTYISGVQRYWGKKRHLKTNIQNQDYLNTVNRIVMGLKAKYCDF